MLTHVSLAINETQKCLAVLRQNLVSFKRDHFLPPPGSVLTEDQCDSLRAIPAFRDSLFDGWLQLAKKLKSNDKRDDTFLGLKSLASSKSNKRFVSSSGKGSGPKKKARLAEYHDAPPPYSSRARYASSQRRGRGARGASFRDTKGASGANRQVHPQ